MVAHYVPVILMRNIQWDLGISFAPSPTPLTFDMLSSRPAGRATAWLDDSDDEVELTQAEERLIERVRQEARSVADEYKNTGTEDFFLQSMCTLRDPAGRRGVTWDGHFIMWTNAFGQKKGSGLYRAIVDDKSIMSCLKHEDSFSCVKNGEVAVRVTAERLYKGNKQQAYENLLEAEGSAIVDKLLRSFSQ
jgi:hypothetical protein